jgi:hypothetical protein
MNMNADAYYEAGLNKPVCQDYALAGSYKGIYYAIGADGCSSSPDTDIGARLISLISRTVCVPSWPLISGKDSDTIRKMYVYLITERCKDIQGHLNISETVLDATLWIALWSTDKVVVMGWGDGVVIADYGIHKFVEKYEYPTNAPLYLSYYLKSARKLEHKRQFGDCDSICTSYRVTSDSCEILSKINYEWGHAFIKEYKTENLKSISVCSDGINTYSDNSNGPISMIAMAKEFTTYKIYTGEFVKRRMKKIRKEYDKLGINHFDDIFCATISKE